MTATPDDIIDWLVNQPGVIVTVYADESAWKAARRELITASDASTLCRRNNFQGALRLFYTKLGILNEPESQYDAERRQGHRMEPVIADGYADMTGRVVADPGDYTIVTNTRYPGIGATLDRVQWCPDNGFGCGPELKNQKEWMRRFWSDGQTPEHAMIQLQVQMLLTGASWGSIAACIGGDEAIWRDFVPNKRFQSAIIRKAAQFARCLRDGTPPEPTGHDTDFEVLDELYPEHEDSIDVGASLREYYDEMIAVTDAKKPLDEKYKECQAKVRAAMGPAKRAIGIGYEFSISTIEHPCKYEFTPQSLEEAIQFKAAMDALGIEPEVKGGRVETRLNKKGTK